MTTDLLQQFDYSVSRSVRLDIGKLEMFCVLKGRVYNLAGGGIEKLEMVLCFGKYCMGVGFACPGSCAGGTQFAALGTA